METQTFFYIVAGVLQGNTLAPYLFIICQDYVLRTSTGLMKEKQLFTGKGNKQKIPRTNDYRCGLRWWHNASGKYTRLGPIPAA